MSDQSIVKRLELAVIFLKDYQRINVDNFWLVPVEKNIISVNKASNYLHKENLTPLIISNEIRLLKSEFDDLKNMSKYFLNFINKKQLQYIIYIDYGRMGTEIVGQEKNGILEYFI